jgi:hypothetical protein
MVPNLITMVINLATMVANRVDGNSVLSEFQGRRQVSKPAALDGSSIGQPPMGWPYLCSSSYPGGTRRGASQRERVGIEAEARSLYKGASLASRITHQSRSASAQLLP